MKLEKKEKKYFDNKYKPKTKLKDVIITTLLARISPLLPYYMFFC